MPLNFERIMSGLSIANGSAANPTITFVSSANTGLFLKAANSIGFSSNGSEIASYASNGNWTYTGILLTPRGTMAAPAYSFSVDSDTGLYSTTANKVGLVVGGKERFRIEDTGTGGRLFLLGDSAGANEVIASPDFNNGHLKLIGGTTAGFGAEIRLFGEGHATLPSVIRFLNDGNVDGSLSGAGLWTLGISGGTQTHVINGSFSITQASPIVSVTATGSNADSTLRIIQAATATTADINVLLRSSDSTNPWSMGRDTSDSYAFKIDAGSSVGSLTYFKIATDGTVTFPASTSVNITGPLAVSSYLRTAMGTDNSSTGTLNDVSTSGTSFFRFTNNTGPTVTGLANGSNGKRLTLSYSGSGTMQINNNDSGSSAANRIITGTSGNIVLQSGMSIDLIYDSTASFWRVRGKYASGMTNPMTLTGDIIYSSDNSGTPARLGIGNEGATLKSVGGIPAWVGGSAGKAVFGGGRTTAPAQTDVMDTVLIGTAANATSFGNLTAARYLLGACSSDVRGVFCGGDNASSTTVDTMDYITLDTNGNATSFGVLTFPAEYAAGCGSSTRGLIALGYADTIRNIDYITIATAGNSTSFGNLTDPTTPGYGRYFVGALSNTTRGIFAGGFLYTAVQKDTIDYVTIATTGDATNFGNLLAITTGATGAANSTRGVFGGGNSSGSPINTLQYITIATTGNATSFGNLTVARYGTGSASNKTRGLWAGGTTGTFTDAMDYIDIATTGNATSFGNLTGARYGLAGCSDSHGGI